MYRFVLIVCIAVGCDGMCHDNHSCRLKERLEKYNYRHFEKVFDKTARYVISADEECQHNCNINTVNQFRENYSTEGYIMKYTLPEYSEEDFVIKIKHRVIYVNAQKENGISFRDVRALPQNVRPYEGSWYLDNGELIITFNYKAPMSAERTATCSEYINDSVQILPRLAISTLRSGRIP